MQEIALAGIATPYRNGATVASTASAVVRQPTVILNTPGNGKGSIHLTGLPAVLVIVTVFAVIIGFVVRHFRLRRMARGAQAQLRLAEAEQRSLFAAMEHVVLVIGRDGTFLRAPVTNANARYRPSSGLVGRNAAEVLPPRIVESVRALTASAIDSGTTVTDEISLSLRDGGEVWFLATVTPLDANSALWVARDVTEQKQARDAIAKSEAQYRLLFEANPCAMWVYDVATTAIIDVNDAAVVQYGYSREEFRGMTLAQLRPSEDVAALNAIMKTMDPMSSRVDVVRHVRKDGTAMDVEVRGRPLDVPGRVARLVVVTDVTDRLRAEAQVRATSATLQSVIDAAPQAILSTDNDWRVTRWNRAAEELFGWTAAEVLGKPAPCISDEQFAQIRQHQQLAETGQAGRTMEVECVKKDGGRVYTLLAVADLRDVGSAPVGFVAVFTDLTERMIHDEQQRQSQKMEAVGRLAGGIAHDFNNILTVISSYARLLLETATDDHTREDVGEIAVAAERASALTRQLLAFSRRDVVAHRSLDMSEVVRGMEPMLLRLLNADITLVSRFGANLDRVTADPSQIEQVVMNLVVNASDAMPNGGTLVMETGNTELDAAYARTHSDVVPGNYVMLAITDTGKGMDATTMSKVFEPFFTTKDIGRGTGLGLATVYAIVKQLHGHVWVYSEPEHGTTFKIYLPQATAAEPVAEPEVTTAAARPPGSGTVLLVEDDEAVRRVVRRLLEKMRYNVLEASDGAEGLKVVEQFGKSVDVVLTDLMMPNMNGRELANALAVTNPGLHVLFTSGYTDDAAIRRGLMESAHAFLQKPFTAEQLARTLAELQS